MFTSWLVEVKKASVKEELCTGFERLQLLDFTTAVILALVMLHMIRRIASQEISFVQISLESKHLCQS